MRILMVGLDGAGKTAILYRLKSGEVVTTIPTIGYNDEIVEFRDTEITIIDVGGLSTVRALWQHFFEDSKAVIYVVDSTDRERIGEAESELSKMLEHEHLRDAVILLLANKQDLPNAMDPSELAEKMRMQERKHQWCVQGTSAQTGSGLLEGLEILYNMLPNKSSGEIQTDEIEQ